MHTWHAILKVHLPLLPSLYMFSFCVWHYIQYKVWSLTCWARFTIKWSTETWSAQAKKNGKGREEALRVTGCIVGHCHNNQHTNQRVFQVCCAETRMRPDHSPSQRLPYCNLHKNTPTPPKQSQHDLSQWDGGCRCALEELLSVSERGF